MPLIGLINTDRKFQRFEPKQILLCDLCGKALILVPLCSFVTSVIDLGFGLGFGF